MGGQSPRGSLARGKSRSRLAQDNRHSDSGFGKNTREKDLRSVNSLDACSEATISAWAVGRAWCEKRLRGLTMRSSPNCTSSHPSKVPAAHNRCDVPLLRRFIVGQAPP
ncbi:hypothetical protein BN1723_005737 [Verticillium longisporum]|uniref:Uncharacterized protein n=1 Tax=Verticillium longisporum TaxID=100787 RepID=A0A0G4NAA8_VERLO|nr:hypothetical protein BN1723_005737 [Verticillium longisporum]